MLLGLWVSDELKSICSVCSACWFTTNFTSCCNLMAFAMESHLICSFAGHPGQPGCLWHWALRCWRGASSVLLARKTVMLSSLTLTASPLYETHRNYQRLHGSSSSFTPLPAYPSVTFPCLYKVQYHSRSSNGRNIASYQIEVQSSGPWWCLRVRTG